MKTKNNKTLIVSEVDENLKDNSVDILSWSSYSYSIRNKTFSLPRFVEENADHLKSQYLELIYNLGELHIDGKRIVDCLEIRRNFSYWWMTLMAEKCNFVKSPQIDNIIKLFAFKMWINNKGYTNILLISTNKQLIEAMRLLSIDLGVDFKWKYIKSKAKKQNLARQMYRKMPNALQAVVWFANYLIDRWKLKGVGVKEWKSSVAKITFVSYLFNLVPEFVSKEKYESRYWTVLPDLLNKKGVSSNWLHLYNKDEVLPSTISAANLINSFNKTYTHQQVHTTLDSFLSYRIIINTLKDWYKVLKLKSKICRCIKIKSNYLWPLLKHDCQISFSGTVAISNLLFFQLFEEAMSILPEQKQGFYLQENQGWEFGFIHAWREAAHANNLIGIPHATVRYWDLKYFFDKRSYDDTQCCQLPLPDFVGVNGSKTKNTYLHGGYPSDGLVEVEALRYIYMNNVVNTVSQSHGEDILVLGGKNIEQQVQLLNLAHKLLDKPVKYIVKPHPRKPIQIDNYPNLPIKITDEPISKLLNKFNIVYTDNITSAAVDAYCSGKQVVTFLDPNMMDFSPLRGAKEVLFVSSAKELADALKKGSVINNTKREYFYINSDLCRWKELIM